MRERERRHPNEAIHCCCCYSLTGHGSINAAMLLPLFVGMGKMRRVGKMGKMGKDQEGGGFHLIIIII